MGISETLNGLQLLFSMPCLWLLHKKGILEANRLAGAFLAITIVGRFLASVADFAGQPDLGTLVLAIRFFLTIAVLTLILRAIPITPALILISWTTASIGLYIARPDAHWAVTGFVGFLLAIYGTILSRLVGHLRFRGVLFARFFFAIKVLYVAIAFQFLLTLFVWFTAPFLPENLIDSVLSFIMVCVWAYLIAHTAIFSPKGVPVNPERLPVYIVDGHGYGRSPSIALALWRLKTDELRKLARGESVPLPADQAEPSNSLSAPASQSP